MLDLSLLRTSLFGTFCLHFSSAGAASPSSSRTARVASTSVRPPPSRTNRHTRRRIPWASSGRPLHARRTARRGGAHAREGRRHETGVRWSKTRQGGIGRSCARAGAIEVWQHEQNEHAMFRAGRERRTTWLHVIASLAYRWHTGLVRPHNAVVSQHASLVFLLSSTRPPPFPHRRSMMPADGSDAPAVHSGRHSVRPTSASTPSTSGTPSPPPAPVSPAATPSPPATVLLSARGPTPRVPPDAEIAPGNSGDAALTPAKPTRRRTLFGATSSLLPIRIEVRTFRRLRDGEKARRRRRGDHSICRTATTS